MCEDCSEPTGPAAELPPQPTPAPDPGPDRRSLLTGMLALPVLAAAAATTGGLAHPTLAAAAGTARLVASQPPIIRRAQWGGDLRPKGAIPAEDVKFLLVHHTSEPGSNYQPGEVVGLLRSIYNFHTGPSKGWPDVAYNFFVDKFGTIYEGRTGSVDGPQRGSGTGGNQGYSQLCCFLGDFNATPPPAPALASMYSLLAWLADRYSVDTTPGATVQFTSLGSNKWPAGSTVRAATISGHRDVSQTDCPGNACYALVRSTFPQEVSARRGNPAPTSAPPTTQPSTTAVATTTTTAAPTTEAPPETTLLPSTTAAPATTTTATPLRPTAGKEIAATPLDEEESSSRWPLVAGVAVIGAAALGAATTVARRRNDRTDDASPADTAGGATAAVPVAGGIVAKPGCQVMWRVAVGHPEPTVDDLAAAAARIVGDDGWWDDLAATWQAASTDPANRDAGGGSGSFLVGSDGERAVIRLAGAATGVAVMHDGTTSELTRNGVTRVWLTSTAAVRFALDGHITELSDDGVSGPVDQALPART